MHCIVPNCMMGYNLNPTHLVIKLLSFTFTSQQYWRVFFFSFAYTTSPAAVMKLVVFFRSSKPPYNFWWSGVANGHCAIRSGWCLLHLWRTCSVVWSSSPQGHVGEGTIFCFLCMCALSLLWPKPPGRACQEGGMHPSPVWASALFWWWWSFPGNGWWLLFLCTNRKHCWRVNDHILTGPTTRQTDTITERS